SHLALCLSVRVPIYCHFVLNRSQVRVHVAQAATAPFKGWRESFSTLPECLSPYILSFCFKYKPGECAQVCEYERKGVAYGSTFGFTLSYELQQKLDSE